MNITTLPTNVAQHIMHFLDWQDLLSIKLVSKGVSENFSDNKKFWSRECLRVYFSFDLRLTHELYEYEEYRNNIKQKANTLSNKIWGNHFKTGKKIKLDMKKLLRKGLSSEDTRNFIECFYRKLKEPELPPIKLKRETVTCHTNTLFQNKLSEVLYEDSENLVSVGLADGDLAKTLIDTLLSKYQSNGSTNSRKSELLKLRWYNFEQEDSPDERSVKSELTSLSFNLQLPAKECEIDSHFLLEMLLQIHRAIQHYCAMVYDYLKEMPNGLNLLAEYYIRWDLYVMSMLELEKTFESFTTLINKAYEGTFPDFPGFPKFSIWRLMVKTWLKEVYERADMPGLLASSFLQILHNHRIENIFEAAGNNFNCKSLNSTESEVPKNLYLDLNAKNILFQSIKKCAVTKVEDTVHPFFSSHPEAEKQLPAKFIQSMLDLSFNEVSIHFLDCTDLNINHPYHDLEKEILNYSNHLYEEYTAIFRQSPNYFCHFLKSDFDLLAQVLPERTLLQLEKIQIQKAKCFQRSYVCNLIAELSCSEILNGEITSPLKPSCSIEELGRFFDEIARGYQQENLKYVPLFEKLLNRNNEEANDGKLELNPKLLTIPRDIVPNLVAQVEKSYTDFIKNFEFLINVTKKFEEAREKDAEIKRHNQDKNIPVELGDVDSVFYDLDKHVDIHLICKLYAEIKGVNIQSGYELLRDTTVSPKFEEDTEWKSPGRGVKEYMDFGLGRDFDLQGDDFDLEDLPDIGSLSLKK